MPEQERRDIAAPAPAALSSPAPAVAKHAPTDGLAPSGLANERAAQFKGGAFDRSAYVTISDLDTLDRWIAGAHETGVIAIDTETSSLDAMQADLIGVSMALAPGLAAYVPIGHVKGDGDLFGGNGLMDGQLREADVIARLKPLLEAPDVVKIAQNAKFDWLVLAQRDIDMAPVADTMLASYVLDAGRNGHGMDELSEKNFGHKPLAFGEVAGQGKTFIGFARVAIDRATEYSAEDADVTLRLWRTLGPRLPAESMMRVYETLERPMVGVLGGTVPTNTTTGYHTADVNMDGVVKYTGSGNDRDPILVTIGGTVPTNIRAAQHP